MSDITELERRLTAAMDRIARGIDAIGAPGGADPEEMAALKQALEDEKLANAQLEERIKTLHTREEQATGTLRAELDQTRDALTQLDAELQRLRKASDQLRENVARLREANAAGVAEPHLINKAMLAELEALRAARAVDVAEADAIKAVMMPLLSEDTGEEEGEHA
jgi:predicted  nucleic acid-binding Zn-ribbon protein